MNKKSSMGLFLNGIIKENPVLVLLLGMCPALGVTTMAMNGIGMGLVTTFVLLASNIVISMLRNIIPKTVRLPCYIVIIAGFVTFIDFMVKGYAPELHENLGAFLALVTVNCIIFARAEVFASKNGVIKSSIDALGMGAGFTIVLLIMGSVREIFGEGKWFGIEIPFIHPMAIFTSAAGGFFVLGVMIAVVNIIGKRKPPQEISCENCPSAAACSGKEGCE